MRIFLLIDTLSDNRISGIYTTREEARKVRATYSSKWAEHITISEREVDTDLSLQSISFDELKKQLSKCNDKFLMYLMMLANGELMDRCDKHTLGK